MDGAECFEDFELVAALNVFGQGGGDCVFLGFVVAYAAGLLDQFVIQSEVGCHVYSITQWSVYTQVAEILRWEPLALRALRCLRMTIFSGLIHRGPPFRKVRGKGGAPFVYQNQRRRTVMSAPPGYISL